MDGHILGNMFCFKRGDFVGKKSYLGKIIRAFFSILCVVLICYSWYKCVTMSPTDSQKSLHIPGFSMHFVYWSFMMIGALFIFLLNFKTIIKRLKEYHQERLEDAQKHFIQKELKRRAKKENRKTTKSNKQGPAE